MELQSAETWYGLVDTPVDPLICVASQSLFLFPAFTSSYLDKNDIKQGNGMVTTGKQESI